MRTSGIEHEIMRAAQAAQMGQFAPAIAALEGVLKRVPGHAEAARLLGQCYGAAGRMDDAVRLLRRGVELAPRNADAWAGLGTALAMAGERADAATALRKATELAPRDAEHHGALGTALVATQDYAGAERAFARAAELNPAYGEAVANRAGVLQMLGRTQEAAEILRRAARDFPANPGVLTNACCGLNYAQDVPPREVLEVHRAYGRLVASYAAPAPPPGAWPNAREPDRRLRVGLLSPDLNEHSVSHFLLAPLAHRDPGEVEYAAYMTGPVRDAMTQRLRGHCGLWRDLDAAPYHGDDGAVVRQIREDRCDVLLELSGHTQGHRLHALAWRAAPVQATYLGYPNTTGVPAIDARLVDSITDPPAVGGGGAAGAAPSSDELATERLVRLDPCFLCYTGADDAPEPGEPPAAGGSGVTFGSFNSIKKITPRTLDLWSAVLRAVPGSRLVLKSPGLHIPAAREHVMSQLASRGVEAARVSIMERLAERADHLAAYRHVDIALDTFPYTGTTTTCEALWMGVPVVTRLGEVHASRVSASLLRAAGLPELVAEDDGAVVSIAAGLASDGARLADLRRSLRGRVRASALCDGAAFARRFEAALRRLWQAWCAAPAR